MSNPPASEVLIDLATAIMRVDEGRLECRLVADDGDAPRLPFGPFMPNRHRTMEMGLRQWVREQVGVDLAHVEQLYTFADQGRADQGGKWRGNDAHTVSVGYLALTPPTPDATDHWGHIYTFFPWEDWRDARPPMLDALILPALDAWLQEAEPATERVRLAFGRDGAQWDEEFVLERYELLYEAGLVGEAARDGGKPEHALAADLGAMLQLDHRRILATALGRLRAKLKYRPVLFDLMADEFTLRQLQDTTEQVMGIELHTQNFRRLVEKSGFVIPTGRTVKARGRPAEIFRFRHNGRAERPLSGLRVSSRNTVRTKP
jgi:hypothetical protein